ncbi:MAG: hypothetical protein K2X60_13260 [Xanthobacteraceae bacterium]|nr:hypothetical protein [Xanthobacteraceae bacterium]MBY0519313.1 hypothetical protein [Sphingomonas sp.]
MMAGIRNYWSSGCGPMLLRYAVLSYGIAAIEWLLSPPNLLWVFPSIKGTHFPGLETAWWIALGGLALAWLATVAKGIYECGWPGVVLLLPVMYGLFLPYLVVMLLFSCFFLHSCL